MVESMISLRSLDLVARVGEYQARDAVWADGQPLVIGRDFDFALAAGLSDGVGVGIAAAKRQRENRELALRVAEQPQIGVESLFEVLVRACGDCQPTVEGQRFAIYGILYGAETARLRVVVEATAPRTSAAAYVAVSGGAPATALAEPAKLRASFEAGLTAVAEMMRRGSPSAASAERREPQFGACALGGSATSSGRVIASDDAFVELATDGKWAARLRCPLDAFSQASAPPPGEGP